MPYVFVQDVAASWEHYARFAEALAEPPSGLILHAAGPTDEGFRIIDVWESEEAWRRFADGLERPNAQRFVRELQPTNLVLGRVAVRPEPLRGPTTDEGRQ